MELAEWGLVPSWTKSLEDAKVIKNKTLNARAESIFSKPSFKEAAINKRSVLFIDGFYEHHHRSGKTFPYFIQRKDKEQMAIAALSSEWSNPVKDQKEHSFSIVTTKANNLMSTIHNNPNLPEPRMPLILRNESIEAWLSESVSEYKHEVLDGLMLPISSEELISHTVKKFKRDGSGKNDESATDEFHYPELGPTLFD